MFAREFCYRDVNEFYTLLRKILWCLYANATICTWRDKKVKKP